MYILNVTPVFRHDFLLHILNMSEMNQFSIWNALNRFEKNPFCNCTARRRRQRAVVSVVFLNIVRQKFRECHTTKIIRCCAFKANNVTEFARKIMFRFFFLYLCFEENCQNKQSAVAFWMHRGITIGILHIVKYQVHLQRESAWSFINENQ